MGTGKGMDRRDLFKLGAAAAAGVAVGAAGQRLSAAVPPAAPLPPHPLNAATREAMPTRNLGKTGFKVGIFSLGGQAALEQPDNAKVAVPIIERALDLGVNYIDTSARYGGSERWSERYIGEVMAKRRSQAYLATKTHDRTRDGSLRILEKSLALLRTDHVDLWQLHAMSTLDDVEKVFAKGGALEAFQRAKEQKLVRHLGITGHTDPDVLAEAIRRFPFDAVLMAFNAADPHRRPFQKELLPLAVEKGLGIIGMKIPARGRLVGPSALTMREAMGYVLSQPVSTVIVGVDTLAQLEENVALARAFTPFSAAQNAALEAKAAPFASRALWFRRA